uniref:Uncharacterized protein n=1 Tax=viral metagenome TaxID=1070528 RepID=A0A6C0EJC1_9ZZZZ
MTTKELNRRNRYKWSVNEILSLQREYELQELTIQEIAFLHRRSAFAILHKLEKEQIINNFNEARGYEQLNFWDDEYNVEVDDEEEEEEEEEEEDNDDNDDDNDDDSDDSDDHVEYNNNLSLQKPTSYDDEDNDDKNIVYFEDALIKKIEENSNAFITEPLQDTNNTTNNLKNTYDNKELFYIVYKLIGRIENLEHKLSEIENTNANSFLTFIKNWFIEKRLC